MAFWRSFKVFFETYVAALSCNLVFFFFFLPAASSALKGLAKPHGSSTLSKEMPATASATAAPRSCASAPVFEVALTAIATASLRPSSFRTASTNFVKLFFAELHKDTHTVVVHVANSLDPLHRPRHVLGEFGLYIVPVAHGILLSAAIVVHVLLYTGQGRALDDPGKAVRRTLHPGE